MRKLNRRKWLKSVALVTPAMVVPNLLLSGKPQSVKTILVVSGWQDVNIGDIAHTPGLLHILNKFIPRANIILWKKSKATAAVTKLLQDNFPKVKVIYGDVNLVSDVNSADVMDAFNAADIMIHGSGPSVVGAPHLQAWSKHTGKPFGIFGTTIQNIDAALLALLKKATFIYTRETASLKVLRDAGLYGDHITFAPDATFYLNIHNLPKASAFLDLHQLKEKQFICAVPRLRYTPYHKFSSVQWTEERIAMVERVNAENKEKDHAKLREAMIAWVRETGNKVLVCPEMTYEVDIMDELLIDPLPEDVKKYVIKRGYWLPDEAASVYAKAHTVLSFECHSPIIAAANGTPFIYLRQPEDTIKGQMYYDLDFKDWVFEIDQTTGTQISNRLREFWRAYKGTTSKLQESMEKVGAIYASGTALIKKTMKEA